MADYIVTTRTRHGYAKRPVYAAWLQMRQRCYNTRNKDYPTYGGRGITVCDRWRQHFLTFLADVGERPKGCSLDRIDNNRGYEPENVRWAPLGTQNRNTRATKLSERKVAEMRQLHAAGWSIHRLARLYCVARKTVQKVLHGDIWRPLPEPDRPE